ncbi:MAG TPA: copper homeostasis protein CutC [Chitinophagaceae bacterium]|nr:copper homeostasis protein CutC [Chitinophagaceae bacterium]
MSFTLEICCYSYSSCLVAAAAGADRIELCADAGEGGTTAGYGTIKLVKEKIQLPVYPIIRPRGGDFFYSDEEFSVMKTEILLSKELGCEGVVIGMLQQDGSIDKERCSRLVALAYPMGVTFHRAFDRANNPFEAMEEIIQIGCERILTSGHKPVAADGIQLLNDLVRQANDRISIMPGSGIRAANIIELAKKTGASEFHSSASIKMNSNMQFVNAGMQETLQTIMADADEVSSMKTQLSNYFAADPLIK